MLLRFSATSPYVRKVLICAIEAGLEGRIERMPTAPGADEESLAEHNPLGKVPALVLDDGTTLYDSPVVCEYLDSLHERPRLIPPEGPERWAALRRQALADGLLDAAIMRRIESLRLEGQQSADVAARQKRKIDRALDAFEADAEAHALADPRGPLTIAEIAAACALGYLDHRFPDDDWRLNRPALASWFDDMGERPSMAATRPPESA